MPSIALPYPGGAVRTRLSVDAWAAMLLMIAAVLIRMPNFGNPAYDLDEEFYLLVGDRMLHGALPYVDIWDRKPVGLFLIYSAIRLLGGDGIYQYQIVAAVFAGGTAWLIHRIAYPVAGRVGALIGGLLYLLWIETVQGGGGQAPIFYNLFVAGTAACTLAAFDTDDARRFRQMAFSAMALGGIAIQIKYTSVFEIGYFGVLLAWRVHRDSRDIVSAMLETASMTAVALAPTIAALLFYTAIGQLHAFWFANFQSIFLRSHADPAEVHSRLVQMVLHVLALSVCYGAGLWHLRRDVAAPIRRWQWIVSGWLAVAIAGFFSIGAIFTHYMLPLFVPLSVAATPIFRRKPLGPVMAAIALWLPSSNLRYPDFDTTQTTIAKVAAMQALIPPDVDTRCMQMFAGPPILYLRTHACLVTRYIFPDHLVARIETQAIGTDTQREIARVIARRPRAIVSDDSAPGLDPDSINLLKSLLPLHYRRAGRVEFDGRQIDIWLSKH